MKIQRANQNGAALFVGLILLSVLMIIGITAVRNSTFQEKMAANVHQANWIFGAADAGMGAFNELANNGDDVNDTSHILFRARSTGSVNYCVDQNGGEAVCGGAYLDGQAAEVAVQVQKQGCVQQLCFGYSLGTGTGSVKCLVYRVNSTGTAYGLQEEVEWWAYQISAQC